MIDDKPQDAPEQNSNATDAKCGCGGKCTASTPSDADAHGSNTSETCGDACASCEANASSKEDVNTESDSELLAEAGPDDEPTANESGEEAHIGRYVLKVQYGLLIMTGRATSANADIKRGDILIIKTKRGTEIGKALQTPQEIQGMMGETIGHVLRLATDEDIAQQEDIENVQALEELRYCRAKLRELGLPMKLSALEHVWGGERLLFYFTAERRVDFRSLVRDLAWKFHTRIELRQIGARDEAKLVSDYEHCGRELCCKSFMSSFEPVTMRMAKLQRTTLDPAKISGRCGRLMCCLRFEDDVYRELKKNLPHRGVRVCSPDGCGNVVNTDIISQNVTFRTEDGNILTAHVDDLLPEGQEPPPRAANGISGRRPRATSSRQSSRPVVEVDPSVPTLESINKKEASAKKKGAGQKRDDNKPRRPKRSKRGTGRRRNRNAKPKDNQSQDKKAQGAKDNSSGNDEQTKTAKKKQRPQRRGGRKRRRGGKNNRGGNPAGGNKSGGNKGGSSSGPAGGANKTN